MKITFDIPDHLIEEVVQVLEYPQSVIPRAADYRRIWNKYYPENPL